ncbi:hypothetical protein PGT21_020398 [Puccinia graminis f. sp. tritici]|uniref:Uncharacterized protein n=1 Tax=Puccinia graminis f. sp. tritici TaxID=56615 RepID=A0A5B0PGR7_PUCGR|nr:hypothetical protein PGT21_020398 [Puccinia graminis f. sp. tritici]
MSSAHHLWFLRVNFLLIVYLKLSICSPPTPIPADLEVPTIGALEHRPDSSLDRSESWELLAFQSAMKSRKVSSDYDSVGGRAMKNFDLNEEYRGQWDESELDSSGNGSRHHDTVSSAVGDGANSKDKTFPSQSDSPTASNSLDSQHGRQVEISTVSKKRSRDDQLASSEFRQPTQTMLEGEMTAQPESHSQSLLNHADQGQQPILSSSGHSPIKFEMLPYDEKWHPFFDWVKGYFFQRNSELQSESIKRFLRRLEKEQVTLNEMLPNKKYYKKLSSRDISLEIIHVDEDRDIEGFHDFIILPKGIRGAQSRRGKCLTNITVRVTKILETAELLIGLASLQEMDPVIFGPQWENTRQDFMEWIEKLFFEATEDSLPIFGQYRNTWTEAEQAANRFGDAQKALAMVLVHQKKHNDVQQTKQRHNEIYRVSLSLLEYWYKIRALKLGRSDPKGHPENLWIFAESVSFWKDDLSRLMKSGIGASKKQNQPQDNVVTTDHQIDNQELDFFAAKIKEHFGNSGDIQHKESLFTVVSRHQKKGESMITQGIRAFIRSELEKSVLALQDHFSRINEPIKVTDLPIYLIPASRHDHTLETRHVFINLSDGRDGGRTRTDQVTLFESRILKILESLSILCQIASVNLGVDDPQKTHQILIDWYLASLFKHSPQDGLPLFGWVQIVFPFKQPPEELFGIPQKFLSKELTTSRPLHRKQAHKLAFLLFSFWYEEIAVKRGLFGPIDDQLLSFGELWQHF